MNLGTRGLESSPTQIHPIDGNAGDSSAVPAFEPHKSTDMLKPDKDTTYVAFLFKEGIILACHSHMSMRTTMVPKIVEINSHILGTMVGGDVDKLFQKECQQHKWKNNQKTSTELASECLEEILGDYSEDVAALVAGWEPHIGPLLFLVDKNVGGCLSVPRMCVRFGKHRLLKEMEIRRRFDMSVYEAASFALWVIHAAVSKDGIREGVVSVYYVGPRGWKKMLGDDVVIRNVCCPVTLNTVDQKMAEEEMVDQEIAEEEMAGQEMAVAPQVTE